MELRNYTGDFADDALLQTQEQEVSPLLDIQEEETDYGLFEYNQYDWTASGFNPDYSVIKITQGYFSIVEKRDVLNTSCLNWSANIQRNKHGEILRIYAYRTDYSIRPSKTIFMHQWIMRAGPSDLVDHRRRYCLDNRRCMLRKTSVSMNARNTPNKRRVHDLPRGVEYAFGTKDAVKGVVWLRDTDGVTRRKRSPLRYPATTEGIRLAYEWHCNESERLGLVDADRPPMPIFPPLKKKSIFLPKVGSGDIQFFEPTKPTIEAEIPF